MGGFDSDGNKNVSTVLKRDGDAAAFDIALQLKSGNFSTISCSLQNQAGRTAFSKARAPTIGRRALGFQAASRSATAIDLPAGNGNSDHSRGLSSCARPGAIELDRPGCGARCSTSHRSKRRSRGCHRSPSDRRPPASGTAARPRRGSTAVSRPARGPKRREWFRGWASTFIRDKSLCVSSSHVFMRGRLVKPAWRIRWRAAEEDRGPIEVAALLLLHAQILFAGSGRTARRPRRSPEAGRYRSATSITGSSGQPRLCSPPAIVVMIGPQPAGGSPNRAASSASATLRPTPAASAR